jgi:hypothetical protein
MIGLRSENGCGSNYFRVMMKLQGRLMTSLALDANVITGKIVTQIYQVGYRYLKPM